MLHIAGEESLLRQTIKRVSSFFLPGNVWIVTTEDKARDIGFHLEALGSWTKAIKYIKEPTGKDTAPAVGMAAVHLHHLSPESVMAVMPSDHAIPDPDKFLADLGVAIRGAKEDHLVTFGIKPNRPETGYGYIKVDKISGASNREEHLVHRTVERPWGNYTVLEKGARYKIKRIVLHPNAKLSLQTHHHRSEHWVVVSGTARVMRGEEMFDVHPNESTFIPISVKHRLENPGKIPLQIIEVLNGDYVEEDDIERFDDAYQRIERK